ncbi:hypothetical protein HYU92_05890 [Candidatus Curtissbacteria bacterium]|nr:hypothetical protein [Candidatus Curtissbacteria bacterium]
MKTGGRARNISLIILFFALLVISFNFLLKALIVLPDEQEKYQGRYIWVESVNLYLKTGKILMFPKDRPFADVFSLQEGRMIVFNKDQRLEDVWPDDDQGYPFTISLLAKVFQLKEVSAVTFIKFNYLILMTFGVLAGAALFLAFRSLLIAILFYFLYLNIHIYDGIFDHHWLLGAYLPFYLTFLIFFIKKRRVFKPVWFAFYVLVAGIANILRGGDGHVGILLLVLAMLIIALYEGFKQFFLKLFLKKSLLFIIFLIAVYILPSTVLGISRYLRDQRYFNGRHTDVIPYHGFWHGAFMGLGYIPNKYGIKNEDTSPINFARKLNPQVKYQSFQYHSLLRRLYFEYSFESPSHWLKNYLTKLLDMHMLINWWFSRLTLDIFPFNLLGNFVLYVSLFLIWLFSKRDKMLMSVFWLIVFSIALSTLPGFVRSPGSFYLKGLLAALFMTVFYLATLIFLRIKPYTS